MNALRTLSTSSEPKECAVHRLCGLTARVFGRETRSYSQRMYLISAHALEDAPVRQGCRSGCAAELRLKAAQHSRFGLRLAEGSCSSFFVSAVFSSAFRCFSAASRRTKL